MDGVACTDNNRTSERLQKLRELKLRRIEAKKLNRSEVVEEDRRGKLPKNWENRQQRAEYKLNEIQARQECSASGKDYDREKLMTISAADAERKEVAKKRKKDPDLGFSSNFSAVVLNVFSKFVSTNLGHSQLPTVNYKKTFS